MGECACVGSASHLSLFVTVTVRLVASPPPSVQDRCRKHHAAPAVGVAAGPPCGPGSGSGAPESKRSGPLRSFTHGSEAKNWPETEHSTEQTVRGVCEGCMCVCRQNVICAWEVAGLTGSGGQTAPAVTFGVACVALFLPTRTVVHAPTDGHVTEEEARARLAR